MVPGIRQAHGAVKADPKDDIIIAAALESKASYIVSEQGSAFVCKCPEPVSEFDSSSLHPSVLLRYGLNL